MKNLLLILVCLVCLSSYGQIVPGSSFPVTNNPPDWSRFLMVDTNGQASGSPLTRSNMTMRWDALSNHFDLAGQGNASANNSSNALFNIFNFGAAGFVTLITNGSSTATIQAAFNSLTNGGVVSFQPGAYTITSSIVITNSMSIAGNGATLSFALGATNAMLYCPTNYEKPLAIDNLRFDGGQYSNYVSSFYFQLYAPNGNDAQPYHNTSWSNRTGLKLQITGGVAISHCYFYGWAGSGSIFYSLAGARALNSGYSPQAPKLNFSYNTAYSNFMGCMLAIAKEDISGYYNGDTTGLGDWSCEYSAIFGNDFNQNYLALYAAPGNCLVENNMLSGNWHGLYVNGGNNSAHGTYEGNVMNHNVYPIWSWFARGGLYQGNSIWRNPGDNNTTGGIHFDHCSEVSFVNNRITYDALTFTNDCDGTFAHNIFETNGVWGGPATSYANPTNLYNIPTNFIGSPLMLIYDNHGAGGWRHDGSASSVFNVTTNSLFARSFLWSPDGTNAAALPITNMVMVTNLPATPGQALIILGTNAAGALLVMPTNWPTGGGGTSTLLPPNALGVLTNNGSGTTNWSTSILGTWIGSGTIPPTALNSSFMPVTNAIAYSNSTGLPIIGNALVIIGTNSYGAILTVPTNWPTGGSSFPLSADANFNQFSGTNIWGIQWRTNISGTEGWINARPDFSQSLPVIKFTPAGDYTYAGLKANFMMIEGNGFGGAFQAVIIVTNSGVATTITSNSVTTGNVTVNGGTSNWLGGISFIPSNAAPFSTVAPSGLNTITMNQRWTNNLNRRADLLLNVTITDAATGVPVLGFTNTITGESYTNSPNFGITGSPTYGIPYLDISPGDYGSISNYSTGSGTSITINSVWWKLH